MKADIGTLATRVRGGIRRRLWRAWTTFYPGRLATFCIDPEFGGRFRYPLRSGIGRALYLGGFESAELAYVRRTLKRGQTFFDVGANGGIFTIQAAPRVGASGQVHCFEPGLAELDLLRANIDLNRLTNVHIYAGAVTAHTGSAQFAVAQDGAMSSLAKTDHPGQVVTEWRTVPTVTLDDYARQQGITHVDFIKIDVEGAEKLVLAGASDLLRASRPLTILFEASSLNAKAFGHSVESVLEEFLQRGASLHHFDARGELATIRRWEPCFGNEIYSFVAKI